MNQEINSSNNPKIKKLAKLFDKGGLRREEGVLIVETERDLRLALAAGLELLEIYWSAENEKKLTDLKIESEKIFKVSEDVFKKMTYREHPLGVLAVFRDKKISLEEVKIKSNPLVFILEAVEKPGNIGAILRTCDAVGADLLIVNDLKTDIYNPNIIRASLGAVFSVPTVTASIDETIAWLKANNIKSLAAALPAKKYYTKVDWKIPAAIVLGTEHDGLSEKWLQQADELVKIPMRGQMDSLNVSVSAAVLAFEADRQRHLLS